MSPRLQKIKPNVTRNWHDNTQVLPSPLSPRAKGPTKAIKSLWWKLVTRSPQNDAQVIVPDKANKNAISVSPDTPHPENNLLSTQDSILRTPEPTSAIEESRQVERAAQVDKNMLESSYSSSLAQHDQSGRSTASNQHERKSNDTPPSEVSSRHGTPSQHGISVPRMTRRWSCSNMQALRSIEQTSLLLVAEGEPTGPVSAAKVAEVREQLTASKSYINEDDPSSGPDFMTACPSRKDVLAARRETSLAQMQLRYQQHLSDCETISHEKELKYQRIRHAREIEEPWKQMKIVAADAQKRVQAALALTDDTTRQLSAAEGQLHGTQDDLESVTGELELAKAEIQRLKEQGTEEQLARKPCVQPRGFGMKSASPANKRYADDQSAQVSDLNSKLQNQCSQTAQADQRADELQKELDEARSEKTSIIWEISELRGDLEIQRNKTYILQYRMEEEPGKTEQVDNQLKLKDEAYKELEEKYGNCLANNAELQSKISSIEENADFKVSSLKKKVAKKDEHMLDLTSSRDAYVQAFQNLTSHTQEPPTLSNLKAKFNQLLCLAQDENRQLRLHLQTSEDRISQLEEEVVFEKSKVAKAQKETREQADEYSQLEYEKRQADREIEHLKLRSIEHDDIVACKDLEAQNLLANAQIQIDETAADLQNAITNGAHSILAKKNKDLRELRALMSQRTQQVIDFSQQVHDLQEIRFWDTDSARRATEANEADRSRMVVAEEQVAKLLQELSEKNPTLHGMWDKWLQTDAARMRQRQVADEATSRLEECLVLGRDLFNHLKALHENFNINIPPGTELANSEARLGGRAVEILASDEPEDRRPAALYPLLMTGMEELRIVPDDQQNGDMKTPQLIAGSPAQTTAPAQSAQLMEETPNTRANRIIAEKEKACGIFQKADGTWDIAAPQQGAIHTQQMDRTDIARGDTPSREYSFSRAVGIKLAKLDLQRNLERLAKRSTLHFVNGSQAGDTASRLYAPTGLDAARDMLQRNLEYLAETSQPHLTHSNEPINARPVPRLPPGLDAAQDTLQRNHKQLSQVTLNSRLPPGLDNAQAILQQNQQSIAQLVSGEHHDDILHHPRPRYYAPMLHGFWGSATVEM